MPESVTERTSVAPLEVSTVSRTANVWEGDIVRIGAPRAWARTRRWLLVPAFALLAAPIVATWADSPSGSTRGMFEAFASVAMILGGVLLVGVVFFEVARALSLSWSRSAADIARAAPAADASNAERLERLATRLWAEAMPRSGDTLRLDVAAFLHGAGASGPRVLAVDEVPPPVLIPGDVFEEVDMAQGRPIGRSERRRLMFVLPIMLFVLALQLFWSRGTTGWTSIALPAVIVAMLAAQLARVRMPVRLGGASAVVGEYCYRPLLGLLPPQLVPVRRFTRADSVLLLHDIESRGGAESLRIAFLRNDGATRWLTFPDGWKDSAFQQLLARWTYRPRAGVAGVEPTRGTLRAEECPDADRDP